MTIIRPITIKNDAITIRQAQIDDAIKLPAIEQSAGQLFATLDDLSWISEHGVQGVESHIAFIEKQAHWVAVDENNQPVGFVMTQDLPDSVFIHELSVSEAWQNKGIGKKLIQKVIDKAKERQFSAITLTTFRHVPWNAPFYQRLGFEVISDNEIPYSLREILEHEITDGGFAREARCAMQLEINNK